MVRYKVANVGDLKPGTMMHVDAAGVELLVANVEGQFYALAGRCTHMKGKLWEGTLKGFTVKCPRHGTEFDVRTGQVLANVRIPLIGKAVAMRTYPVVPVEDEVFVEL
jgi:3-phenylpropionate/trans-cinnamate dioxygenase ferredoxin subunit